MNSICHESNIKSFQPLVLNILPLICESINENANYQVIIAAVKFLKKNCVLIPDIMKDHLMVKAALFKTLQFKYEIAIIDACHCLKTLAKYFDPAHTKRFMMELLRLICNDATQHVIKFAYETVVHLINCSKQNNDCS